jgi:hypothetical protein
MLSIEECKKYLEEYNLTDEEIRAFRDGWYNIINAIIDEELGVQNEETKD